MIFPEEMVPFIKKILEPIMESKEPEHIRYTNLCLTLNYLQGTLISRVIQQKIGNNVFKGPFKGMHIISEIMHGNFGPELLGVYEIELHPVIERIIATPYKQILNIGSCHGYYAVGLARRMPNTHIFAFDIDESACINCAKMAEANNVKNQIEIIPHALEGETFATYAKNGETLVFMDIEGAEEMLLNPTLYPALTKMDILVELHDCFKAGISERLLPLFQETHTIEFIYNKAEAFPLEEIFGVEQYIDHHDSMAITTEGRNGPTPWAFMKHK